MAGKNYIKGFNNRVINVYCRITNDDKEIMLLYPGQSYGLNGPLFIQLVEYFNRSDINYIFFDYDWSNQKDMLKLTMDEFFIELDKELIPSFSYLQNLYPGRTFSIIAKSLGSRAIELLSDNNRNFNIDINKYHWVTPFINTVKIPEVTKANEKSYFIYVGSDDPYYNEEIYSNLNKNIKIQIYKNENHSLECSTEIIKNIYLTN